MFRRVANSSISATTARVGSIATPVTASAANFGYAPRLRDTKFHMEEVYKLYDHYKALGYDVAPDLIDNMFEEAAKFAVNEIHPLYLPSDDEGCKLQGVDVITPKGFKEAYAKVVENGWLGVSSPEKYGGQGMPTSVGNLIKEVYATANWPWAMYPGLSAGAAQTLARWGNEEQKEGYLTKLIEGTWTGTMCLTEPHCGTDLNQVKTKAAEAGNGTYKINGTKIFISAGDHDFTENIVHIVLAKLPGAPEGTKGISLFLVPRNVVKEDGSLEPKKNVICTGLEHKMGIKSSATCQLTFEDSIGYLIGKENEGMKAMFTFMNMARVGTAVEGVAHAELAFQNALPYALERTSMRSLSGTKFPDKAGDPIICHASVRHNLLFAKSIAEGGRAFIIDMSRILDLIEKADEKQARVLDSELGLLTPIAKGFLTELGIEAAMRSQQIYGGHGYIKANGMEQIVRDARIATIYEGTTGVQALDLIARKVLLSKTNDVAKLSKRINGLAKANLFGKGPVSTLARQLYVYHKSWKMLLLRIKIAAARDRESVGSASEELLYASGYLMLAYYWLRMASVAYPKVKAGQDPDGFYQSKIDTATFYFGRVLPRFNSHVEIAQTPSSDVFKIAADKFLVN